MIRTATAIAVLAAALLPGVQPARATAPGQNGKIAYMHRVVDAYEVRTVSPDGPGDTLFSSNAGDPAWSPDGTKLAYAAKNPSDGIWVADANGANKVRLTSPGIFDDANPTWSPDGSKILFVRSSGTNCSYLYRMNADGSALTEVGTLACAGSLAHDLDWSPSGDRIAFGRYHSAYGSATLVLANPDLTGEVELTSIGAADHPSWSPSGDWIAYSSVDTAITTPDAAFGTRIGYGYEPDFSPDGTHLVVQNFERGLTVINDAGGYDGANPITYAGCGNTSCADSEADWQPVPPPPARPGYPRPKGASPFSVSLVPAFDPCAASNRTHGAPLAFGSCSPPAQSSGYLTVGTFDANGAPADSIGRARITPIVGNPSTPADEADVRLATSISDVRCRATVIGCAGGPLSAYTGALREQFSLSIVDRYNGGSALEAATGQTFQAFQPLFRIPLPCTASPTAGAGSVCSVDTTVDTLVPGAVREGDRAEWQLGQIQVWDAGEDGNIDSDDNTLFAVQGVFVP